MKKMHVWFAAFLASIFSQFANATVATDVTAAFTSGKTLVETGAGGWIAMVAVLTGLAIIVGLLRK